MKPVKLDALPPHVREQAEKQLSPKRVLPGRGKNAPKSSEHKEQAKLFKKAKDNEHLYPVLAALFAIPNGGMRFKKTAAILKREGVKAGVNDVHLPCPIGGYAGLWVEMKYGYNNPSQEQAEWMDFMRWLGHRVEVCYSADEAWEVILDYINAESSGVDTDGIIDAVCTEFGVTRAAVFSNSRKAIHCYPRHAVVYLLRRYTELTLEDIGRVLDRHHSTVMASIREAEDLIRIYPDYREKVERAERAITQTTYKKAA